MKNVLRFGLPILVFVCSLLLNLGCERPDSQVESVRKEDNLAQSSISLEEAKIWFTGRIDRLNNSSRKSAGERSERDIDWNSAKKTKQNNGLELVIAPVKYKGKARPAVIGWDSKTSEGEKRVDLKNVLDVKECVFIYKDKSGNMQHELVQYISSKEYKKKKNGRISDGDFTGWVMVMSWDEDPVLGFEFKEGKAVKNLSKVGSGSNNRLASCEYYYNQTVTVICNPCDNSGSPCTDCTALGGGYTVYCTSPSSDSGTNPNTGVNYGGSGSSGNYAGSPYDANYAAPYTYNVDQGDHAKWFVFKLKGSVVVNNRCQHEALKNYLSIIPSIETDYNNKVWQCLVNNSYSGDALEKMFRSLTMSGVAKELANMPWSNFLTVARGILGGLSLNMWNANTCVKGVQGDTDSEITKAYNAYMQAFNKSCN